MKISLANKFQRALILTLIVFSISCEMGYAQNGVAASTAGPTAPEATSFEPFDATDMVNMLNGDLSYTVPLIEVPGPAGSYPIALSYHAGIKVRQEPTWVGLGWNINPGTINRSVNGIADDANAEDEIHESYWVGGETVTESIGISVGFELASGVGIGVNAGLQIANDTYEGRGVGGYVGASAGIQFGESIFNGGVNARIGISPYGEAYAAAGVSAGVGKALGESGLMASANLGLSVSTNNGASAGVSGGISIREKNPNNPRNYSENDPNRPSNDPNGTYLNSSSASLLGISLSSGGNGAQVSVGGGSRSSSATGMDELSTSSSSFGFSIPIYYGISISYGRSTVRYWIRNKEAVDIYGSLYQRDVRTANNVGGDFDFETDVYDLFDSNDGIYGKDKDPNRATAGTYPDYDAFSVSAQGIGGTFQPFHLQRALRRATKFDDKVFEAYTGLGEMVDNEYSDLADQGFRFVGDFSNSFVRNNEPSLEYNASADGPTAFVNNLRWDRTNFADENSYSYPEMGYDPTTNLSAGSKHVEYFTNSELDGNTEIVSANCIDRSSEYLYPPNQIGGFKITGSNGLTYHFMLPAYSRNESVFSKNMEMEGDNHYIVRKAPYAYTWYLTAITGPDYVERGGDGLDDKDYGYWIKFEYSRWNDERWRNPRIGYNKDIENGVVYVTSGKSERYYLDKIKTGSHTALFVKSTRIHDSQNAQLNGIYLLDNQTYNGLAPGDDMMNLDPSVLDDIKLASLNTYEFDYGVFGQSDYRLRLDRLWNKGIAGADMVPPTIFRYKELSDGVPWGTSREYDQNAFDHGALFKSDYFEDYDEESVDRLTSEKSSKDVDMWSLNEIITTSGQHIKLRYEADTYSKSILNHYNIPLHGIEDAESESGYENLVGVKIVSDEYEGPLIDHYNSGADIKLNALFSVVIRYKGNPRNNNTSAPTQKKEFHFPRIYDTQGMEADQITVLPRTQDDGSETSTLGLYNNVLVDSEELKWIAENPDGIGDPSSSADIRDQIPTFIREAISEYSSSSWLNTKTIVHIDVDLFKGTIQMESNNMSSGTKEIAIDRYWGGIRVKEVISENPITHLRKGTIYDYTNYDLWDYSDFDKNVSSGTLLYEEGIMAPFSYKDLEDVKDKAKYDFLNNVTAGSSDIIKNARLLPGSEVLYEHVAKRSYVQHLGEEKEFLPTYSSFEFQMFHKNMINHEMESIDEFTATSTAQDNIRTHKIEVGSAKVEHMLSQMGQLRSIELHSSVDESLLSQSKYHFLHDQIQYDDFPSDIEKKEYFQNYGTILSDMYDNQGLIQETFSSVQVHDYSRYSYLGESDDEPITRHTYKMTANVSSMDAYPIIKTGETHIDYRTGTIKSLDNVAFDMFSGEVITTETDDGNGRRIRTEIEPAYWHYPAMGLKFDNAENKQMLTQQSAQTSYLMDDNGEYDRVLSASVTTWDNVFDVLDPVFGIQSGSSSLVNQNNVWRQKATYQFIGEGLNSETAGSGTPIATYQPLFSVDDWTDLDDSFLDENHPWLKNGEITLYDSYSHALEAKNEVSGQYAATKMTADQTKVMATAMNSRYEEMAFSGAEQGLTDVNGVVILESNIRFSPLYSHSGVRHVVAHSGEVAFEYSFDVPEGAGTKKYRAMVWCYLPAQAEAELDENSELNLVSLTAEVGGQIVGFAGPNKKIKTYGSWHPIELVFEANAGSEVVVTCENNTNSQWAVSFDDFRVQPYLSGMQAYVYDELGRLSYSLDNNNFYTQYRYDAMGRLTEVIKEINYYVPRFEQSHRYFNKFSENKMTSKQ